MGKAEVWKDRVGRPLVVQMVGVKDGEGCLGVGGEEYQDVVGEECLDVGRGEGCLDAVEGVECSGGVWGGDEKCQSVQQQRVLSEWVMGKGRRRNVPVEWWV